MSSRYGTSRCAAGSKRPRRWRTCSVTSAGEVEIDIAHLHLDRLAARLDASAAEQRRGQDAQGTRYACGGGVQNPRQWRAYWWSFRIISGSEARARRAGNRLAIITASASVSGAAIQIQGDADSQRRSEPTPATRRPPRRGRGRGAVAARRSRRPPNATAARSDSVLSRRGLVASS